MSGLGRADAPDLSPIRDDVRALMPFQTHPAAGLIKLDAMENPFGLPEDLMRELGERLARLSLNRYPPIDPASVKRKLAESIGLPDGCSLMPGNGSDELIHIVIQACATPGATILSPWPSFLRYAVSARLNGSGFQGVPLTCGFAIDEVATVNAISQHRPVVSFVAWPNNPTGNLFNRAVVERIIQAAAPGFVVLDEAYLPFAQDTWLPQLERYSNLLILRTFSKMGLAGIRFGFLCGRREWVVEFEKVRPPYNVSSLTLEAVDLALDHLDVFAEQTATLRAERERMLRALTGLPGVHPFASAANFVLIEVTDPNITFKELRERGILVANVSRMHSLLAGCLRVTIGRPEENDALLTALGQCQSSGSLTPPLA